MGLEEMQENRQERQHILSVRATHRTAVTKDDMIDLLCDWGKWQRTAKRYNGSYAKSQYDTPLQKKRNVKVIYKDGTAELIEELINKYLPEDYKLCLILCYVERKLNPIAAHILKCSTSYYIQKREQAIAMIFGIYLCQ